MSQRFGFSCVKIQEPKLSKFFFKNLNPGIDFKKKLKSVKRDILHFRRLFFVQQLFFLDFIFMKNRDSEMFSYKHFKTLKITHRETLIKSS